MISVGHHGNILSAQDNLLIEDEQSDTFNSDDKKYYECIHLC